MTVRCLSNAYITTMNYKNLNYEIETRGNNSFTTSSQMSMNYKNLNYEIET